MLSFGQINIKISIIFIYIKNTCQRKTEFIITAKQYFGTVFELYSVMKIFKILILFMCLSLISVGYSEPTSFIKINKQKFSLIDQVVNRESDKILNSSIFLNAAEKSKLKKVVHRTIVFIKGFNPLHHVKEILVNNGKGAAIVGAISEALTGVVFPYFLHAQGLDFLIGISIGTPTYLITPPLYVLYAKRQEKIKALKDLKIKPNIKLTKRRRFIISLWKKFGREKDLTAWDLSDLNKLRKEILLFEASQRTSSYIIENENFKKEIHIIDKKMARKRAFFKNFIINGKSSFSRFLRKYLPNIRSQFSHVIEVYELEDIVKKHYNSYIVFSLKEAAKKNQEDISAFYTSHLLFAIEAKPKAKQQLLNILEKRAQNGSIDDVNFLKILLIHEKISLLKNRQIKIREIIIRWKKSSFFKGLTFDQKRMVIQHFESYIIMAKNIEKEIVNSEYIVLDHFRSHPDESNFSYPYEKLNQKIRIIEDIVQPYESGQKIESFYEYNQKSFFKLFKEIEEKAVDVKPTKVQSCLNLLKNLI